MKGLNLSKFKMLSQNENKAILKSSDGHEIHIAKKALHPDLAKQISELPVHKESNSSDKNSKSMEKGPRRMLAGGTPDAPLQIEPIADNDPQQPQASAAPQATPQPDPGAAPDQTQTQAQPSAAPDQQPVQQPAQEPPPADPYGATVSNEALQSGIAEQKAGLQQQMVGEQQQGRDSANALESSIKAQTIQRNNFTAINANLTKERQGFLQDIQNQHIDPQHYLNSMGTGQKISTGIGLIMGGLGGAMTHSGQNPALNYITSQINNDIEAQRLNLGKSQSLLEANLHQYGNMRDAAEMTRMQQNDIVSNQMKLAAARAQDPMAQARMLQAAGQN